METGLTLSNVSYFPECELSTMEGWKQKTLLFTLTYVEITSSGVNCMLNNSRGGKSRSRKGY